MEVNEFRAPDPPNRMKRCRRRFIFRWSIRFSGKAATLFTGSDLRHRLDLCSPTGRPASPSVCTARSRSLLVAAARGMLMRAYGARRAQVKTVEAAPTLGIPLRRRRRGSIALLGMWCFLAFARTARSVRPSCQLLDDDRLRDGNLRAQLRQRPLRRGADLLRLGADDGGAAALRQRLSLDLRRPAGPVLLRH